MQIILSVRTFLNQIQFKPYPPIQILTAPLKPSLSRRTTTVVRSMTSAEESDVGILCYISPLPGFRGILKQRYSDFIVNEVDMDGNVVHLTSLEAPPSEAAGEKKEKVADQLEKDYASEIESFRTLVGDSDAEKLKFFIDQISSGVKTNDESIVLSPSSDKTHRTAVHNFFKERLKFLVTDTVDGPDSSSKCIRVRLNSGINNNARGNNSRKRKDRGQQQYDSRGTDSWPDNTGKFLRFYLYKENKDTQEALGILGKMIGVQPRSFGFAGTKDKRSVSTQRVTVFKQRASKLAALNDRLFGIKVGNFCYVDEELVLGKLQGNRFTITLRSVSSDVEDIIRASATALGNNGFINYFGLQRFGSSSIPTHLIGAALLRGEWKAAVSMILDPREGEKDVTRTIREYYKESGDIEGTLRQLPRHLVAERSILYCFQKNPGNYLQALLAIPRTLRMMFVHSYQSYLWNHAASMRVQKYGMHQVVLGDLVYCKDQEIEKETKFSNSECEDGNGNDTHDDCHVDELSVIDLSEARNTVVKVISEEDIAAGTYTIDDIVLPLPGSRITYPLNDIGKIYHDIARKDNISLTDGAHNSKEFSFTSITGAYRRVFQKPKDFEWELLKYTDANIPLAETDLDIIAKSGSEETERVREEDIHIEESLGAPKALESQMALKLSFTLPSSCYATMAIRELLKTSTSVAFHKAMN
ncbi:PREDICTED: multisubstrate pseudouridine synthase 7 isoform X2 [Erythranthe guttata]|uniref:multisubstrate pseudouridine synthase 7 isoform X2 n=1 Tax=Erythranthe guttata TaxID=4155 RepID=UPI00064DD160|nr:PREDICTED: multisubstrate pseudouridine synthase 7 isoform X2 [Erythranthe guttata]|eukprot:XP_012855128.1 PREDICTED: multisubstrate pseudouridine synthase 7 isoform X2 [Erythranthe guttata]